MSQNVSPSSPFAMGCLRGSPLLRPVVSSRAHHGTYPARREVIGLTMYLATAVVSRLLFIATTRAVAQTAWDPRGTRVRSWRAGPREIRPGIGDPLSPRG